MFLSFPYHLNRALVLELVDNGTVKSLAELANYFVPRELSPQIRRRQIKAFLSWHGDILDGFVDLGLIESIGEGWRTTSKLKQVTSAVGISLTELARYTENSVHLQPIFGPPSASQARVDVFVLMPFDMTLRPVYEDHIAAICTSQNVTVARADDFFAANVIVRDIWNAINNARVIVADCTKRNPNVFYEIGLAHTIGRPTILIAQSIEDIPFDLRHIRCLIYEYTPRGMASFGEMFLKTLQYELRKTGVEAQNKDDVEEEETT